MIEIVPYNPNWPREFQEIGRSLRAQVGDLALRIDHIGSTSVPGLAAKDKIDMQMTVAELSEAVRQRLLLAGYQQHLAKRDHPPAGTDLPADQWEKLLFTEPVGQRLTNLHVRVAGRANQRYPLLFRDYLRADPVAAGSYRLIKQALAQQHPHDQEAYYDVKDPVTDLIMQAAERWAVMEGWVLGESDC
ncbi:MAG: GrpB family protein [Chloroflexota bacterium]